MDIVHKSQVSHMFTNRKSHMFHMAVCLVAAVAGFAALAAKPAVAVTASLRDGSTVRGEFLTEKIAGATLFEKNLALAPSLVRSINFSGTNGESKVELSNGDRFAMTVSNDVFAVRSLLGNLKIPRANFRSLTLVSRSATAKGGSSDGLVYYCTFNSREDVSRPKVGPRGFFMAGDFTKGVDGLALHVPPYTSAARFELPPGTIGRKGTIEFWGKIDEGMARLTTGGCPRFFEIICYEPRDEISQDWNSNNGTGGAVSSNAATLTVNGSSFGLEKGLARCHLHGLLNIRERLLEHSAAHLCLFATIIEVGRQIFGFQMFVIVEVSYGLTVAVKADECAGTHEQRWCGGFHIGLSEASNGAILQCEDCKGVVDHLLALGCI